MAENVLYWADNLDVLRRCVEDETIDLIYLDPPFKSNRTYRVRPSKNESARDVQIARAFDDRWHWNRQAEADYQALMATGGRVPEVMHALRLVLGDNDLLAYLIMMAPRLMELRRTLKNSGSLYLHCDATASHYLKLLLDATFGAGNFKNEIIWHYGGRGAKAVANRFPRNHDTILFYVKRNGNHRYHRQITTRLFTKQEGQDRGFRQDELGRWYKTAPRGDYTDESIRKLEEAGRIYRTKTGTVRIKYFLREEGEHVAEEVLVDDTWTTIPDAMHIGEERLGYPTQKPEGLVERIVRASSNEGDVVLDPFCGCGTTLAVAQRLNRRWIGIECSKLAIALIQSRLKKESGGLSPFTFIG